MSDLFPVTQKDFSMSLDGLRKSTQSGAEYWRARDLQDILGYRRWEGFSETIHRAEQACESSGVTSDNHFRRITKKVEIGSGAMANKEDYVLSRYACYLIAMNGDPKKAEIGFAQTYFAVQTRRQELADAGEGLEKRIAQRNRIKLAGKALNIAAKAAGVRNYGTFYDAGYKGLYGGIGLREIKRRKGLVEKDDLFDRVSRAELAANEFRITQTEEKLRRENVAGEFQATNAHHTVGQQVRQAIHRIGGTMPEAMAAEESLKVIERRNRPPKISRKRGIIAPNAQT